MSPVFADRGMVAQWVALLPHSKKVPGFSASWARWPFCVELACSPRVTMPKNMQVRWISESGHLKNHDPRRLFKERNTDGCVDRVLLKK